jgi:alpha-galactosidase
MMLNPKRRNVTVASLLGGLFLVALQGCSKSETQSEPERVLDSSIASKEGQRFLSVLKSADWVVEDLSGKALSIDQVQLDRAWNGTTCKSTVKNIGDTPLRPKNILLFEVTEHGFSPDTPIYGEGFQMLYQNGGTLGKRENIGNNLDSKHYKIPDVRGLPTAYGVLNLNLADNDNLLLGFASCHRFIGRISFDAKQILVSIDAEGLVLEPGESWVLEDFIVLSGERQGDLFNQLAEKINQHHPPRLVSPVATGWCSWYCYRMDVTDQIIRDNLDTFTQTVPELKFIQLDDGYQPFFGDWFDPNPDYGDVKQTIADIRAKGFEPAIWVAPFIAQKESRVLREHPDWFVKNAQGEPLDSSTVSFGGWRYGPWYALDGTHPEVQQHFKNIFRTMREEWGVNYFKLDANYWGAIQEGAHYEENASRIEAYRQGMQAMLRGCDDDTILLGCNAPIWPSFGLVTAMRTSGDIRRRWSSFKSLAQQNLSRAWQNGTLWDADPDCIVLAKNNIFGVTDDVPENEWMFHATSIHAVGGFILSGDKAEDLGAKEVGILKKLLTPTGKGARFANTKLETGITDLGDTQYYYFFNWSDTETMDLTVSLSQRAQLNDFWTDDALGIHDDTYTVTLLPPRSARLVVAQPIPQ